MDLNGPKYSKMCKKLTKNWPTIELIRSSLEQNASRELASAGLKHLKNGQKYTQIIPIKTK